jgi:hypothetical protein
MTTITEKITREDIFSLYEAYLSKGKEALTDPNLITIINFDYWRLELYRKFGALVVTHRRVEP